MRALSTEQFLIKKGNRADFPKAYNDIFAHIFHLVHVKKKKKKMYNNKRNSILSHFSSAQLSINDLISNKLILILSLNNQTSPFDSLNCPVILEYYLQPISVFLVY